MDSSESWFQSTELPISGNVTTEQQGDDEVEDGLGVIDAAELLDTAITMLPIALPAPATTLARILPKACDSRDVLDKV